MKSSKTLVLATIAISAFVAATHAHAQSSKSLPGQIQKLNTTVSGIAGHLAEISDALTQLGSAASKGTPIQLRLRGLFEEGSINLVESILGPISFTAPSDKSMLVRFVTCEATRGVGEVWQFDIRLEANFSFEGSSSFAPLVQFVPGAIWESLGPFGDRAVASTATHAYLNIPSPAEGAPEIGDLLQLRAQRNGTAGTGGVDCTVSGVLFDRPEE